MMKKSYFIVVDESKGGPGSAETPNNGTGSSINEVDSANVIPSNKIVTIGRYCDGVDVAASELSTLFTGKRLLHHVQVVERVNPKTSLVDRYVIKRKPFKLYFPSLEVQNLKHRFSYRPDPGISLVQGVINPSRLEDCPPFTNDFKIMNVEQYPVIRVLELIDKAVSIIQEDVPNLLWTMYLGRCRINQMLLAVQVERV